MPALVSGTSNEFLGKKPLPRSIRDRPMVFLLGPPGVGKSSVARVLAGDGAHYLPEERVLNALNQRIRDRKWHEELLVTAHVIVQLPCFLDRRPAALECIQDLLRHRAGGGRRTWVIEPESGTSMAAVMGAVHPGYRATVVLRFPVGRGRLRFARRVCEEMGVAASHAAETVHADPWTYERVRTLLSQVAQQD